MKARLAYIRSNFLLRRFHASEIAVVLESIQTARDTLAWNLLLNWNTSASEYERLSQLWKIMQENQVLQNMGLAECFRIFKAWTIPKIDLFLDCIKWQKLFKNEILSYYLKVKPMTFIGLRF